MVTSLQVARLTGVPGLGFSQSVHNTWDFDNSSHSHCLVVARNIPTKEHY